MKINRPLKAVIVLILGVGTATPNAADLRSPYQIVEQAPPAEWRTVEPENSLYIELATGTVVVELFADIALRHTANFKILVREGYYDGLTIYRVVDGFVAQGGGAHDDREPVRGKRQLPGEFEFKGKLPYRFTRVDTDDGFAAESGFMHGFALGREGDRQWMLHCPGAFALARGDDPASGGTEFYAVLGQAPRYLDRNVTVFGVVRYGMEHYQALNRGRNASGQLQPARRNPITRLRVGADVPVDQRLKLQVMRTDSASFEELIRSRARRPEAWFVFKPGYVDVCGVPVPVRIE